MVWKVDLCMCHEFEHEYAAKALIKPRVVGNPMYFAPKITLGSCDPNDIINDATCVNDVTSVKFPIKGAVEILFDTQSDFRPDSLTA